MLSTNALTHRRIKQPEILSMSAVTTHSPEFPALLYRDSTTTLCVAMTKLKTCCAGKVTRTRFLGTLSHCQ